MTPETFITTVFFTVQTGQHVLDIGAGQGIFARRFVDRGAHVVAVDPRGFELNEHLLTARRLTIQKFIINDSAHYDLIFARNVLQFLEKHWVFATLFPWITDHLATNGVMAIETFFAEPKPPFSKPLISTYELAELRTAWLQWPELLAGQYEYHGPDMQGALRHFSTTDFVIQLP